MTTRPKLLDLFCGAGGCSMGYHRAGFDVVGVDHRPMPRYPYEFCQKNALEFLTERGHEFDVIHASPPCQAYSSMKALPKRSHRRNYKLIGTVRRLLRSLGRPYIIENVVGAPLKNPVQLCGHYFGLMVRRHRLFESNCPVEGVDCRDFHLPQPFAIYGDHPERFVRRPGNGGVINRAPTLEVAKVAMGIDWMTWPEITQAIPPAYTEYLGRQLLRYMQIAA